FPHGKIDRQLTIDIDDERIIAETPGFSETKILWQAIDRFAQNEKVTMFYTAEIRFIYFPTRSLSDAQRIELNELVARNLVRKEK
ncbi:MAG: YcxB family protein, partial [Terracidiphilus sp.]